MVRLDLGTAWCGLACMACRTQINACLSRALAVHWPCLHVYIDRVCNTITVGTRDKEAATGRIQCHENNEEAHWASMEQERALVLSWLVLGFRETPDCGCSDAGAMSAGVY